MIDNQRQTWTSSLNFYRKIKMGENFSTKHGVHNPQYYDHAFR